jgi:hypothetical protein
MDGGPATHRIRVRPENWGPDWRALVAAGPVSRLSDEPVYSITDRQLRLLRRMKLAFDLLPTLNGVNPKDRHGPSRPAV